MSLEQNLSAMERTREAYWLGYPATSPVKLRWRALTVRHCFHVLPGRVDSRARRGQRTMDRASCGRSRGENPITAAVFNQDLAVRPEREKHLPNTHIRPRHRPVRRLSAESFDYVVGTAILCHDAYAENLRALYRLLKPGGQLLFFEANYWNPQVFLKNYDSRRSGRWAGDADCQIGMRKFQLMQHGLAPGLHACRDHPLRHRPPADASLADSRRPVHQPSSSSTRLVVRDLCGTLYIWAGEARRAATPPRQSGRPSRAVLVRPRSSSLAITKR